MSKRLERSAIFTVVALILCLTVLKAPLASLGQVIADATTPEVTVSYVPAPSAPKSTSHAKHAKHAKHDHKAGHGKHGKQHRSK